MKRLFTGIATVMLLLAGSLIWKAKGDNEWCWKSGTSNEEPHTH